jgi:hypothetical protein
VRGAGRPEPRLPLAQTAPIDPAVPLKPDERVDHREPRSLQRKGAVYLLTGESPPGRRFLSKWDGQARRVVVHHGPGRPPASPPAAGVLPDDSLQPVYDHYNHLLGFRTGGLRQAESACAPGSGTTCTPPRAAAPSAGRSPRGRRHDPPARQARGRPSPLRHAPGLRRGGAAGGGFDGPPDVLESGCSAVGADSGVSQSNNSCQNDFFFL